MPSTMSDRLGSMQFERGTDGGTKLKRIIIGVVVLVAALFLLPSTFTYINPGNVGIVIHRAGGGVDPRPLDPGVHTRIPFATGIEEYPVFLRTVVLTKSNIEGSGTNDEINVNSVEGQPVSLDVSLSFELDPAQTPKLYSTFRTVS
jgi:regulator of protease activity HflC (stomatin/prohibitin superfamily)